ncbi:winged helix-turn-helix domain-containing protein [Erwinia sp. E_sp_B01_9]|uniref:winged helix-turn-helix domain-containing protein n=1 Tax=Erwinia sp. E_sp_B01_9 TaxID=3039403 RepID=UPI003D9BCC7B
MNTPASRCFMLLIQKRGKVVTREEFLQHVWIENGAFVSQNTYYQNISILRRTLKKPESKRTSSLPFLIKA